VLKSFDSLKTLLLVKLLFLVLLQLYFTHLA